MPNRAPAAAWLARRATPASLCCFINCLLLFVACRAPICRLCCLRLVCNQRVPCRARCCCWGWGCRRAHVDARAPPPPPKPVRPYPPRAGSLHAHCRSRSLPCEAAAAWWTWPGVAIIKKGRWPGMQQAAAASAVRPSDHVCRYLSTVTWRGTAVANDGCLPLLRRLAYICSIRSGGGAPCHTCTALCEDRTVVYQMVV